MKKIILLISIMSAQAYSFDFSNSEKIQESEYGVLNPSARALCNKYRDEIESKLRDDFLKEGQDGFLEARDKRFALFLDQAILAQALAPVDRDKALALLMQDKNFALEHIHAVVPAPALILQVAQDPLAMLNARLSDPMLTRNSNNYLNALESVDKITAKKALSSSIARFYELEPSVAHIMRLINFVGIESKEDTNLVVEIKYNFVRHAKNAEDLIIIFGEIIPNGFLNKRYFQKNSELFLGGALREFIDRDITVRQDFMDIRAKLPRVILDPEYEGNRPHIIAMLDRLAPRLAAKIRMMVLRRFRDRLIVLFNNVKPKLDNTSNFQFYLLRDMHLEHIHEGECPICLDDMSLNDPGIKCPYGDQSSAYHALDAAAWIKDKKAENEYPTPCLNSDHEHELLISTELLKGAGFQENDIYEWQLQTLRAYYVELMRLQHNEIPTEALALTKYCSTPNCETLLVHADADIHNNITCAQCDVYLCYRCERPAHPRLSCAEAGDPSLRPDFLSDMNSNIRPCPYCGVPVQKNTGCNSMFCTVCKHEFHWELGAPRLLTRPEQMHTFNAPGPRLYFVEGDEHYREGRESAFPAYMGEIKHSDEIRKGDNRYH